MRSIATTLPIRSLILCAAILAAITVPAHSQPLYEDSARVSHRPLRREPPPAYEVTEEFVTLSEPSEPLQFQIVEEQVPQGEMIYGTDVPGQYGQPWSWQLLPEGLIYRSYLAGEREPRLAGVYAYDDRTDSWLIDATVGARVGLIRYGTETDIRPDGWELDIEGAAFPRLLPEEEMDMAATDFRIGIPLTYGYGPLRFKLAVYHLSAHLGDEYMLKNPDFPRINYVRDVAVFGTSYYATEDLRLYGEAGWAFHNDGGSKPWEFQFGIEYSPFRRHAAGPRLWPRTATCAKS